MPPVAGFGRATLALWGVAFAAFFVPEGIAVLALSRRYPGEGGVYLWARRHFGDVHGFVSGWCYWTNNLFYVPVLLVYLAGIVAFIGGARTAMLVDNRGFVATIAFGWLAIITVANVRGMGVGKWINNAGGIGSAATVVLLVVAAAVARRQGVAATPPMVAGSALDMASGLGVMCFAFIGIELASTMADEIRNPERDIPRAIFITGGIAIVLYLLATDALLALVPTGELGAIQGVMQAVSRAATSAGVGWLVAPVAVVMALAAGGATSAWFAGPARHSVRGRTRQRVAGRVGTRASAVGIAARGAHHLRIVVGGLTALSLAGSSVAEAYQVLLRASVVINLVPFVYTFLALMTLDTARPFERVAGAVGALVTAAGMVTAFLPGADVARVALFELKMVAGVGGPLAIGLWLYRRSRAQAR